MQTMTWAPALPMTELQQWAADAETRGVWTETRRYVMPLTEFPDYHLEKIRAEVESDEKPSQWLRFELCQMPNRSWYEWHWQRGINPEKRREPLPQWLRERVIERDGYICQLCGGDVEPDDVHIDHIKPYSLGGKHTLDNLQVAHSKCNIRKGARWDGEGDNA